MKSVVIFLVFFSLKTYAETAQVFTLENVKSSKLEVECLNSEIKLFDEPSPSNQLKIVTQVLEGAKTITSSDWSISVAKDSIRDTYKLRCHYPEKAMLDKKLQNQYKFQISFKGTVPHSTSIHTRSGKIETTNWSGTNHFVVENGTIFLRKTNGNFDLHLIKGNLDVQDHKGRLRADIFEGKLLLSKVEGQLDLTNFKGTTEVSAIKGDVSYNSKNGTFLVNQVQGSLKFDVDQGRVQITGVDGAIDGVSDQAQIQVKLLNPARFKAKIKSASVKIETPSNSGAQVYFALNEGLIKVPKFLNQNNYGAVKTANGTLRGGESGRISVTGEAGQVSLSTF